MALFSGKPCRRKLIQFFFTAVLGVLLLSRYLLFDTLRQSPLNKSSYQFGRPSPNSSGSPSIPKAKPGTYAVAVFLGTEFDAEGDDEDNKDRYYVGVRTLVYQMLHAPSTRFTSPISVIILAAEGVQESKRQRLRHDGAVVIDIQRIVHSVDIAVPGYHQVFDKLRAFDPSVMPFEKVALLDADMVITRPLDLLFQDTNSTQFPVNKNSTKPPPAGLPELPDSYAIAATPDIPGRNRSVFPPDVDHEKKP
jgi:alpha-N-acetylglucosamine transferase